jgi:hypothetical protein
MNAVVPTNTGSSGWSLTGNNVTSQVLSGLVILIVLYILLSLSEYTYNSFTRMFKDRVELFPDTYPSGSRMYTAIQNPQNPLAKTVNKSSNQGSGVEFSYTMFVYLNSSTYSSGDHKLYHILHKGYNQVYPLMGPGIFTWGDKNSLRVYMNCYDTWNNYTDIDNIPVDKWFHLVVSCKGTTVFIHINGNLKSKVTLSGNTPPYQNYGDVYAFSTRKLTLSSSITTSLVNDPEFSGVSPANTQLVFDGSASGMISRVYYFAYALTYTEIQSLMNAGPSTVIKGPNMNISPYLSDTWWTNKNGP